MNEERARLYLITPPRLSDVAAFAHVLTEVFSAGDVACLQLRLKDASDEEILAAAKTIQPICVAHDVALLINDRPDLALQADADGVHIGQEDASYKEARELLGTDRIIGVTCHDSRHLALEAAEAGADYVAFGAFFASQTKEPKTSAPVDILAWWAEMTEVPCVAIGGLTVDNSVPLIEAGADFLAVSNGVWGYSKGPAAAVSDFNDLIDRTEKNGALKV